MKNLSPRVLLAGLLVAVVTAWVIAPQLFTGYHPLTGQARDQFLPPSLEHLFGTDHLGRDVFTRVVYGSRNSLLTAALAVGLGGVLGTVLGVVSATRGGATDLGIMRGVDALLAVPGFLIALIVVTVIGPGPLGLGLGVGLAAVGSFARLARTRTVEVRTENYVEAAFLNGARVRHVIAEHILPGVLPAVAALAVVELGAALLTISALGFLGLGAPPPEPEWGVLLAEGRQYLASAWWMTALPGLIIMACVAGFAALLGNTRRGISRSLRREV